LEDEMTSEIVTDEIEITPEMIDAGVKYLLEATEDRLPVGWPLADLVVEGLYRRMRAAAESPSQS